MKKEKTAAKKRGRFLAVILIGAATLCAMYYVYDKEFHYADTEAGRTRAVKEFILQPEGGYSVDDSALRILGYGKRNNIICIAYADRTKMEWNNTHGILYMIRGLNGKYRIGGLSEHAFPYTSGVYGRYMWVPDQYGEYTTLFLAGDGCEEIHSVRVKFSVYGWGQSEADTYEREFPVTEPDFLWLFDRADLAEELGIPEETILAATLTETVLLDQDGQDVTEQYRDETVTGTRVAGCDAADETDRIFAYMGLTALLGAALIACILCRK